MNKPELIKDFKRNRKTLKKLFTIKKINCETCGKLTSYFYFLEVGKEYCWKHWFKMYG